jgi:hypothetical protein
MKFWVDQGRRELEFQVRDKVLLRLNRELFKTLVGMSRSLLMWLEGLFEVIGNVATLGLRVHKGRNPLNSRESG